MAPNWCRFSPPDTICQTPVQCHPKNKQIALYIINRIVQTSKEAHGASDLFEGRFAMNLATTITSAYRLATTTIKKKILKLVNSWRRSGFFKPDLLVAILEAITSESKVPMSVKVKSPEPDARPVAAARTDTDGLRD